MKIKRLEIIGFKSFVDKVSLDFQQGITAVVGPNGCGKSNVVDAIRWAMGEQNAKHLRGRSMEDVIFGGSESRKPLGMAEVSLFFSNDDGLAPPALREYAEIMVTRRLHRSGESEYLINKTPCRLKDVAELFMDTGVGARAYSIIEQGKIGMILSAKPEDRRFLIEEAAGVTKYKARKKTALRKIEATRQNLLRLGDITSEVRRQLAGLKRQAQKAERYREYREELKGIEISFAGRRYVEVTKEVAAATSGEEEKARLLEQCKSQLEQGELRIEELRLLHGSAERELAQAQERVFHLSSAIQQVEGKIGFCGKERETLGRQQERLTAEAEEVSRRLAEIDLEENSLRAGSAALGEEIAASERNLQEGESALEEQLAAEQDGATLLEEIRSRLFALLNELSRFGSLYDEASRRLQSLDERAARNGREAVSVREAFELAQEEACALEASLGSLREEERELREAEAETRERLLALRSRLEHTENALLVRGKETGRHRSRLESLQELARNFEGYAGGVKTLLQEPALQGRLRGLVADALEVPAAYEVALEAVLGERLQAVLVDGDATARESLAILRRQGGRGTLLLPVPAPPPVHFAGGEPLLGLVSLNDESAPWLCGLLNGAFLVDDLDLFLPQAIPPGAVLVTKDGEIFTARGELQGGRDDGLGQGLLHKKREMKELAEAVTAGERELERLTLERLEARQEQQDAEETLRELAAALHRQELATVNIDKDLSRQRLEAERLTERIEVLSLEEDQLHEEREQLERQQSEAAVGRLDKETEKNALEQAVAELQEELQVRRRAVAEVRERVTALKVTVASLQERDEGGRRSLQRLGALRQELKGRIALMASRQEEAEREQQQLQAQEEGLRAELGILFRKREEEKKRQEVLQERFEASVARIGEQEESLKVLRQRLGDAKEALLDWQLKGRELDMEAEHLRQSFLERYRFDLAEFSTEDESFDADAQESRLKELRRLIDEMGEVNLTAIDEYRELEERFQFLTAQQDDLRHSLEGLQTAMTKINRTTRKRFRETFDLVNAKFQTVFPRLFRGGRAELLLTDAEDLLESGIDIVVQPPGKRLQSVNLLSGGEKALTAVALIFSIFLIKPSPFCMLDEVDAPLDDANIGRFNELVQEMAAFSQFILITHNKRTMEIADTLYGVTMEAPGVSKFVSVKMNEF